MFGPKNIAIAKSSNEKFFVSTVWQALTLEGDPPFETMAFHVDTNGNVIYGRDEPFEDLLRNGIDEQVSHYTLLEAIAHHERVCAVLGIKVKR